MTDAERIAHELEDRRHRLMLRHVVLSDQMTPLAFDIAINSSTVAKQKLRELEGELDRLADEIRLIDLAFYEAVKRATQRDAYQVMQELGFGATTNDD